HHRTALVVGGSDGRRLGDGRVGYERRLDLEGPDAVTGRDDHIVVAAMEVKPAVRVLAHEIAGRPRAAALAVAHVPGAIAGAGDLLAQIPQEERRHRGGVGGELAVEN